MREWSRIAFALILGCGVAQASQVAHGQDDFDLDEVVEQDPAARERLVRTPNQVEVGSVWSSTDSYKFGDFTGLENKQPHLVANFVFRGQYLYDEGDTRYWTLQGQNLGLDSRRILADFGDQGRYGVSLWFEETPKLLSDSVESPFLGQGSTNLVLPTGWVEGTDTSTMTSLASSAAPFQIGFERKEYGGDLSLNLTQNLSLVGNYARQTKNGERFKGMVIGNSGGNPRAAILPEPIDYTTHDGRLGFAWAGENGQAQIAYEISAFHNSDESVTWQNPFAEISGWKAGSVGFSNGGTGTKALAPDNLAHRATASMGYAVTPTTRVAFNAALGRVTQDETFLPYTGNSSLVVTTPLPRTDLHGEIRTTLLNFSISSVPIPKLRLRANYRYDDRDNRTPSATYIYIGGDSQDQGTISGSKARINHAFDFRSNKLSLGASYRLGRSATLSMDWDHEIQERNHQEVEKVREDAVNTKLRLRPWKGVTTSLEMGYSDRDASTYHDREPFETSHSSEYIATLSTATAFENHPLLRRGHLAGRKRFHWGISTSLTPAEAWNVTMRINRSADDYGHSPLGLQGLDQFTYGFDVSYAPSSDTEAHLFYTSEDFVTDQGGWSFRGGGSKLANVADETRRWNSENIDRADTVGFGLSHVLMQGRARIGMDYVYSRSRNELNMRLGSALSGSDPNTPFGDSVTRLHDLNFYAEYEVKEGIRLRVSYLLERFDSKDWAVDGIEVNSINRVIASGESSPDYRAHLVGFSVLYEFR